MSHLITHIVMNGPRITFKLAPPSTTRLTMTVLALPLVLLNAFASLMFVLLLYCTTVFAMSQGM